MDGLGRIISGKFANELWRSGSVEVRAALPPFLFTFWAGTSASFRSEPGK